MLTALMDDSDAFKRTVRTAMAPDVQTVEVSSTPEALVPIFKQGRVVVVVDKGKFLGLITQIDLIHFLRQRAGK